MLTHVLATADMCTDLLFAVHMMLGSSSSVGYFALLWMLIFQVTLAIKQRRQGKGVWGLLRAITGVELAYRCSPCASDQPVKTHRPPTLPRSQCGSRPLTKRTLVKSTGAARPCTRTRASGTHNVGSALLMRSC